MTAHLTEEEQLEAFKRWWKENGKTTVIFVVLAVAGYFGWQGWTDKQKQHAEQGSETYYQLLQAVNQSDTSADSLQTAQHLANSLKEDHADSIYGSQSALLLAKMAVDKGDYPQAAAELTWVLSHTKDPSLSHLTRTRLARVQIAQGDLEKAQQTIDVGDQGTYKAAYAEIRADILMTQGNHEAASTAYQQALDALTQEQAPRRQILEMKLNQAANALPADESNS